MTADVTIVVVLSLLSILMILIEIFLLPGITVAGVLGAIFSAGSIYYAYSHLGTTGGHITVLVSVVLLGYSFVWLIRSKTIDRVSLHTDIDSKVDTSNMDGVEVGAEGVAASRLNPMGKIYINQVFVEAKSLTGFIDEGKTVVILKKLANQVVVTEKTENRAPSPVQSK
ncbi:MAG: NfeD family protein [Dysgonamonadaceae bacterium]|jgi:membrane-bound ClpP family serine protease|nr:NfeD family protein [Dysgonamonadaceae bacterium]